MKHTSKTPGAIDPVGPLDWRTLVQWLLDDGVIDPRDTRQVLALALAACLGDAFPKLPGLNAADFWRGSMACAGQAQWLAGAVGADGSQAPNRVRWALSRVRMGD